MVFLGKIVVTVFCREFYTFRMSAVHQTFSNFLCHPHSHSFSLILTPVEILLIYFVRTHLATDMADPDLKFWTGHCNNHFFSVKHQGNS